MTAKRFYEQKVTRLATVLAALKKKLALSAVFRVLTFLVAGVSGYLYLNQRIPWILVTTLLFFAAFLFLVVYALRLKDQKLLLEKLLFLCKNELGVLRNEPNQMEDGREFSNTLSYAADLDIFGPGSLFHLLNRCTTSDGKKALADLLEHPLQDAAAIQRRQKAVQTLAPQTDLRQHSIAQGLLQQESEGNLHSVETWLQPATQLHKKQWLKAALWILPAYNIPALIYYIATGTFMPLAIGLGAAWLMTARYARYIQQQHQLIGKKQGVLLQYAGILHAFSAVEAGKSQVLQQLRTTAVQAHKAISKLARLSSLFDQRLNLLVNIFLNSLLLYDLRCIRALEKWKEQNSLLFPGWLQSVGEIECLNSLAGFAFHHPHFCYPELYADQPVFVSTKQMAHPLIAPEERIANDFEAGKNNKTLLITGSNMSGKTTFLRTLGVNLILAQSGAPVCAQEFRCSPMEILTSIRVSDSLQEHTSYFMAELKRLQQIILQLQQNRPALVLIDEILRGTNSEDKTLGSEQFILQLLHYNCITLFATHDLSLGTLEKSHHELISNYCFESIISGDQLHFDYKLQPGIARNKNASFLMKKMGIVSTPRQ